MKTTRLRITLREVTPRVVRVLDVPAASTLPELHDLLQAGIGWTDSHLHQFLTDTARFGASYVDDEDQIDESTATLRDLPTQFTYLYDFGDGWEHDIHILGPGATEPGCVQGEGICPPEDCGGPGGYAELLEALGDPTHPDHDQMREWTTGWPGTLAALAPTGATRAGAARTGTTPSGPDSTEPGTSAPGASGPGGTGPDETAPGSSSPDPTGFDRDVTDALVRDTVGAVPQSVRLLLDLLGDGVRLTPGGRLPRALVRQVQDHRPHWYFLDQPASIEEDLFPLATLHDILRKVGLARLRNGRLAPTKAAGDDLQTVRRLRRAVEPDSFHDILIGVATAHLAAHGPATSEDLATAVYPHVEHGWSINQHPVTPADVQRQLDRLSATMQALDLVHRTYPTWNPGPSATTLLPRATALTHLWRTHPDSN